MKQGLILNGNAIETLGALAASSVSCIVTSPPYWGLRDYDHELQIGLEETPGEYVEKLVAVFDAARHALKPNGTLWLNLGDCYAGSWGAESKRDAEPKGASDGVNRARPYRSNSARARRFGCKPKDLIGIPWMVAFALRAAGWYLRSEIIWSKPNPMPESVTDRPTRAHETIFLFSKSRRYFYNADAIRTPFKEGRTTNGNACGFERPERLGPGRGGSSEKWKPNGKGANKRDVWHVGGAGYDGAHFATYPVELIAPCILAGSAPREIILDPFAGSGTTGEAAIMHNRRFIGIEINPEYCRLAAERLGRGIQPELLLD